MVRNEPHEISSDLSTYTHSDHIAIVAGDEVHIWGKDDAISVAVDLLKFAGISEDLLNQIEATLTNKM